MCSHSVFDTGHGLLAPDLGTLCCTTEPGGLQTNTYLCENLTVEGRLLISVQFVPPNRDDY